MRLIQDSISKILTSGNRLISLVQVAVKFSHLNIIKPPFKNNKGKTSGRRFCFTYAHINPHIMLTVCLSCLWKLGRPVCKSFILSYVLCNAIVGVGYPEIYIHRWKLGEWGMTMSKCKSSYPKWPKGCSVEMKLI